ncbi:hypothetical protein ACFOLC_11730 [Lysobacter cavernae]|uniref:Uncharacterized protein n=1 Tax=Lysobacter cavernae TaxID=1685901 RepID=A0ABV7RSD2_9GAMM
MAAATVLALVVGPLSLGLTGLLRSRHVSTHAAMERAPWDGRLTIYSSLLYALAFNLIFFLQEVFLVVPKALTPGLSPTLFHNNHRWDGEHPLATLFQGTGALAILLVGLMFVFWLAWRPGRSAAGRLFCIWMAYHGCFQALQQVVIGSINPRNDVGMAMDYFHLAPISKTAAALVALAVIPMIAIRLTPQLLALAASPERIDHAGKRARFIFGVATLPALIGTLLVLPFRVPGHPIEVVIVPVITAAVGIGWVQASAWCVTQVPWRALHPARSIWPAFVALVAVLLLFHLVLRPGIAF